MTLSKRAARRQRARGSTPAVPAASKAPSAYVLDMAIARARATPAAQAVQPFKQAVHPPGVGPAQSGSAGLAMDEAPGVAEWAAEAGAAYAAGEGLYFVGYPNLAQLAQRPEYRRISETIATEMTRRWIKVQAKGDENKQRRIDAINEELDRLGARDVFREAAEQDGFFGRGHIYIDLGRDDPEELRSSIGTGTDATSRAKVAEGSLKAIRTVEATWCYPSGYNTRNPLAADWYKPATWYVMSTPVHATRLLTLVGREVPDILKPAYSFGGLSLSQMAKPYVDNWLRTRQSVSDLVSSFSVSGVKIALADALSGNADELFRRIDLFTALRDNRGTMVLDKGANGTPAEEFFNVSTPLGTLDVLQAQAQEHVASIAGIPLVKFTGLQPSGLNATAEGEMDAWYDWIESLQERLFRKPLTALLGFIQLHRFGDVDPDIGFRFEPLRQADPKQQAEIRQVEAATDQTLIDSGVILPEEARRRVASDPDTPYQGLDPDLDIAPPPGEQDDLPEAPEPGAEEEPEPPARAA